jgi:hypothetical protein
MEAENNVKENSNKRQREFRGMGREASVRNELGTLIL